MDNLLEIKDLRVNIYLDGQVITAVDGVNFHIAENETVVLAGESGSGKSITAMSIVKILPEKAKIISGEILFKGRQLLKENEVELRKIRGAKISYIFQEPVAYLNPVYTIGDQIMETIKLHQTKDKNAARKKALELLEAVKIDDPEKALLDYPHQLSGGMNQRAFIAMALASMPKLLIADEPTTSLDVTIEAQILSLLAELKKKIGFSLLFITHNLSIAKKIADRIIIMYKGKIVEEGPVGQIFNAPRHFHTQELLSAYEKIGKI